MMFRAGRARRARKVYWDAVLRWRLNLGEKPSQSHLARQPCCRRKGAAYPSVPTTERRANLTTNSAAMAPTFCAIRRTFLSLKVVALRRRAISFRRGWVQLPGLSAAAAAGAGRFGVEATTFVADIFG